MQLAVYTIVSVLYIISNMLFAHTLALTRMQAYRARCR